jgi:hypothetical protein
VKPQPKRKRVVDKPYIKWIRSLDCSACKSTQLSDPHHINPKGYSSMSGKCDDDRAIPLCRRCHCEYHSQGRDTFEARYAMDYEVLIEALNTVWRLGHGQ